MTAEPLVGRGAELAALEATLAAARRGFAAVEIVGEPGIGKTRLLAELEARADAQGCLVLTGSASELEADLPFGVFVDALDEYLLRARAAPPRRARRRHARGARATSSPRSPAARQTLRSATACTARSARCSRSSRAPKPLVLILDDLHWADSGSLELLGSLLRRPPAAPVLLALAVRPRQVPERLAAALERIARIELGALSPAEARELVGDAADEVYADSGGNPFYLQQLARAPRAAGGRAGGRARRRRGPARGRRRAGRRARAASERRPRGARGRGGRRRPVRARAGRGAPRASSESVALDALDELLRGDLVRPTDVPRRFRFRHPLVRGAVYEGAPGGWRLVAHERSARGAGRSAARARSSAPTTSSAPPATATPAAIAVLREAGAAAAGRAPASAARLFGAALRLLGPRAPERADLLAAQAGAHMGAGQWREAYDAIRECLALSEPPPVPVIATAAALENLLGHHQAAHARLQAALADAPRRATRPTAVIADARDRPRRVLPDGLRRDAGVGDAQRCDAARALGDRGLVATAAAGRRARGRVRGRLEAGRAAADEAAALVDAMPDEELARHLDFAGNALAGAEILLDRYERGGAHAERALAVAEATGQGQVLPSCSGPDDADDGRAPARGRRGARHRDRDRPRRRPRAGDGVEPVRARLHRARRRRQRGRAERRARGERA